VGWVRELEGYKCKNSSAETKKIYSSKKGGGKGKKIQQGERKKKQTQEKQVK